LVVLPARQGGSGSRQEGEVMAEHTKTPWRVERGVIVAGSEDDYVCDTACYRKSSENEANAAFIVRAVNAHDEMVEALTAGEAALVEAISRLEDACTELHDEDYNDPFLNHALETMRVALSKARGE
jgi:hypothetical protein